MTKANDRRAEAQARQLVLLIPQLAMGFKNLMGEGPRDAFPAGRPSPRHIAMLMSLAALGPASVSELATRMNLTLTHASQIVGELAGSALVERREDEHDRRRTIVSVAPGNLDLIDAATKGATRPLMAFCASLSKDDADQFVRHLAHLVTFLSPVAGRPAKAGPAQIG